MCRSRWLRRPPGCSSTTRAPARGSRFTPAAPARPRALAATATAALTRARTAYQTCRSRPTVATSTPLSSPRNWAQPGFPENKKENRGSPALCVSGNFQGKQRVFGAPFWKLASFPESESWSGAKSEAKLRKSTKYPGGRRVNSRYARVLRKIPGILPIWPKIWLILGPNQPRLGSEPKI